jgi:hypothetical protein
MGSADPCGPMSTQSLIDKIAVLPAERIAPKRFATRFRAPPPLIEDEDSEPYAVAIETIAHARTAWRCSVKGYGKAVLRN